jgi:hypothetical protein
MTKGFYLGKREATSANEFVRDMSERIEGRFQLTTDALRWYSPAVDEYLGGNCDYAILIKLFGSRDFTGPDWYGTTSPSNRDGPKSQKWKDPIRAISPHRISNVPT